jgi:hypothetical protein
MMILLTVALMLAAVALWAAKLVAEKEYRYWADPLARFLVTLAGMIYRSRCREWMAGLLYQQREEQDPGVLRALSHLLGAPSLALRDVVIKVRRQRPRKTVGTRRQPTGRYIRRAEDGRLVFELFDGEQFRRFSADAVSVAHQDLKPGESRWLEYEPDTRLDKIRRWIRRRFSRRYR